MTKSISGSGLCYSSADTTSGNEQYNPQSTWVPAMDVEEVRATMKMEMDSGYCKMFTAFQVCNNPDGTIQAAEKIDPNTSLTADGIDKMTTWVDLTSGFTATVDAYQYVRFGLLVGNDGDNGVRHFCHGEIRVEYRMKDS